jgi:PadR family transcriptional regulator PadR
MYYDRRCNGRQRNDSRRRNKKLPAKSGGKEADMTEISSDVIRGYNDTMILYILRNAPSYGYEISKNIKSMTEGKYIIKETTLYSAFTRMEKNGYIEAFPGTEDRRTYYRITEAGKKFYDEKCEEWELTKEVVERFIAKAGAEALNE